MAPTTDDSTSHSVGRPRLPSPERRARIVASKKARADRNREYLRTCWRVRGADPEFRAKRRADWAERRRKRAEAMGQPLRPRGRPRIYTKEEARARRLAGMREYMCRRRGAVKESVDEQNTQSPEVCSDTDYPAKLGDLIEVPE